MSTDPRTGGSEDLFNYGRAQSGSAVIINMTAFKARRNPPKLDERKFSDIDAANLRAQFEKRNIEVKNEHFKKDMNRRDLEDLLKKVAATDFTAKNIDILIITILSYGDNGMLWSKDFPCFATDLMEFFKPGKAHESLTQIPKVFIFQADKNDLVVQTNAADSDSSVTIPAEADFLQVWSLIPATVKQTGTDGKPEDKKLAVRFENPITHKKGHGSCFIDALTYVLENEDNMEFKKMVQTASRYVTTFLEDKHPNVLEAVNYQIPYSISMLRGPIYLPPRQN